MFVWWGAVSTSPKLPSWRSTPCRFPRLFIQYIRSYPPYWRPFHHPPSEDAPCRGDRDPLFPARPRISDLYFTFTSSPKRKVISSCWQVVDGTLSASGRLNATPSKRNRSATTDPSRETMDFYEIISGAANSCSQTGNLAPVWPTVKFWNMCERVSWRKMVLQYHPGAEIIKSKLNS